MENFNLMVEEYLSQEAFRHPDVLRLVEIEAKPGSVRRSFGSLLVRLGLRLDPAAGEGLGARSSRMAHGAGRLP